MRYLVLVAAALLAGCQSMPTKQQTDSADYGPKPNNHEQAIKNELSIILKDPDSAKIKYITKPKKNWYLNPKNFNTKFDYAWLSCANINAKNSFGAYTGYKTHAFFIKNNIVIYHQNDLLNSGRFIKCF